MATVSAFGFGGTDHLNTFFEHKMNDLSSAQSYKWNGRDLRRQIAYQKKMIEFQNEQSKGMSLWSAYNMPAATMRGLKSAGLNPLLAAGGSTNVAPVVASSAASVPMSESYQQSGSDFSSHAGGSLADAVRLFSSSGRSARAAEMESAKANFAEQRARREFFESPEGKKAVRDKLRMDYGPQSAMQAAVLGAHSANDGARSLSLPNSSPASHGTTNQLSAFVQDKARSFDRWFWQKDNPEYKYYDGSRRHREYNRNDNRRDHRRYNIEFNFGSSARRSYDSGSNTNRPVWYNPDLK